jgi:hypothetical protein
MNNYWLNKANYGPAYVTNDSNTNQIYHDLFLITCNKNVNRLEITFEKQYTG